MFPIGNTFNKTSFSAGHARKVWREIRSQLPAGGKVSNISDWASKGKIPAGTPAALSIDSTTGAKTVKCLTDAQVKAAVTKPETGDAPGIDSLGIQGHIQEDIPIVNGNTVGTATVINDGDIYEYMLDSDVVAALKANTVNGYKIVFVQ